MTDSTKPALPPDVEIKLYPIMSPDSYGRKVIAMAYDFDRMASTHVLHAVLVRIADRIAEQWVAEHYQEVVAAISPEAVATLAAANASAEINKTLKEDVRGRVTEVVKREVYQRGIFGGVKRVL